MLLKFLENCQCELKNRQMRYVDTVASGALINIEDYRTLTGKIKGLMEAENILQDVYEALVNSKRLDDKENSDASN